MSTPAHNGYPINPNPEAFRSEIATQFVDGQYASAFTSPGDVIAWGQHALAKIDPSSPGGGSEAIIRTDQGPFHLKDGVITDIAGSERQGTRLSYNVGDPNNPPPDIQIGTGWQLRFGAPLAVNGVLFRDGMPGAPQDANRRQSPGANPFDAAANRLAAVDQQEQQSAQRRARAAQKLGTMAVPLPPPKALYRPAGR